MSRRRPLVLLFGGLLLAVVLVRAVQGRRRPRPVTIVPPRPAPAEPQWVGPGEGGSCPTTHPVKGKLASGIFHLPGMLAYDRTHADRCYRDEAAAESDGLRRAKR